MVIIVVRDGIYSFYVTSDGTAIKGIALIENNGITGFNRSQIYSVQRLTKYPAEKAGKRQQKHWHAKAIEYQQAQRVSIRGFPTMIDGEEDEDQFLFEGESDADIKVRIEIQGAWLHDLPWHRATRQEEST
jgi:hypothetical protein